MYSLFTSRTIRMPCQAVTRCGGLSDQSCMARVLWQKVQFTPRPSDMCIMRAYVHSVCLID